MHALRSLCDQSTVTVTHAITACVPPPPPNALVSATNFSEKLPRSYIARRANGRILWDFCGGESGPRIGELHEYAMIAECGSITAVGRGGSASPVM